MKSELKIKAPKSTKVTYPCLMRSSGDGKVIKGDCAILFSAMGVGTVVWATEDYNHPVGFWCDHWVMSYFEPANPGDEITLTA